MNTTTENCWSTAYWLRNCEGFRVETEDGVHGFVEKVELASGGDPVAFLVRFGERYAHVTRVSVRAVDELDPVGELITLGPLSGVPRSADRQLRIPSAV
jgi:hypothetical protein